jgi:hypothetical protein
LIEFERSTVVQGLVPSVVGTHAICDVLAVTFDDGCESAANTVAALNGRAKEMSRLPIIHFLLFIFLIRVGFFSLLHRRCGDYRKLVSGGSPEKAGGKSQLGWKRGSD